MNDLLKNPVLLFIAGVIALWLVFKLLKIFLSLFWLFVLVFLVMFIVNADFRNGLRRFFNAIFNR